MIEIQKTVQKNYTTHDEYERVFGRFQRIPTFNLNHKIEKRMYTHRVSLPLKKHMSKVFSIEATINGQKLRLLVDTGAQISALFDDVNVELQEEKETLQVGSVSGAQQQQKLYRAKQVMFGSIEVFHMAFTKLKRDKFKVLGINVLRIDGILGWDVLSQFDFSLSERFITFYDNIETKVPSNMISTTFPTLLATDVQGNMIVFGFDSGAHYSWLAESEIKRYTLRVKDEGNALTMGVHGLEKIPVKIIQQAKYFLGNHSVFLKDVHTGYTQIFSNFKYNGILGNELLRGMKIYFINSKSTMILEEVKS